MNEILNKGGSLQGERHAGILWSTDDAFAQVMGKERCRRVRGVGFGPTPTGRSGANLPCLTGPSFSETAHWMTELENSLRDQLAQSEQRHQEAIATLHTQHKEEIAERLAEANRQSDVLHAQQMAESKLQVDEMMAGVKAMLQGFGEYIPATQIMQVLKMLPLIYFQLCVYCNALLCATNTMSIIYSG